MTRVSKDCDLTLGATAFVMCPERCVVMRELGVLLLADTHFGKSETLRAGGSPIPTGVTGEQLDRINAVIARHAILRIMILGDLFHAPIGITAALSDRIATWTHSLYEQGVRVGLVTGNHDQMLGNRLDARLIEMGIEDLGREVCVGDITLIHDALDSDARPLVAGHVHPAINIDGRKTPVFHVTDDGVLTLPAFSRFTAGAPLNPRDGGRVFVVADGAIIAL